MKKSYVLMLTLLFITGITGCAGKQGGTTASSAPGNQSTEQSTEPVTEPAASTLKEITYAQDIAITALNVHGMQPLLYPCGTEAAVAIHNGLVRFSEDLEIEPDLAESWTTSADGREWIFKLRQGVKFHDGTDFDADAVTTFFSSMLDPEVNLGSYSLWKPIEKVETVDSYTVKITTAKPYSSFLNVMCHHSALIPSPTAMAADTENYGLNPVGTGPYTVESFEPGIQLVLVRNGDYYGDAPRYDRITYRNIADASARIAALQSGQVNVINKIPAEFAAQLETDPNLDLIVKPGLQTFGLSLNFNNPALQDKAVRQALNYAIDKEAIAAALYMGYVTPLESPLARYTSGSFPVGSYKVDVAKAESMLEEAGYTKNADGVRTRDGVALDFVLLTPEGSYDKDVILCETLQNQLQAIGVRITINKVESAVFWDQLKVPADATNYDMVLFGFNPSHGSGQIHLEALYKSNPSRSENPVTWNFNWYENPEVDALIAQAAEEVDPDRFAEIMKKAQTLIWEDCPYLWLHSNNIISAKHKDVEGVAVLPVVFTLPHR